MDKPKKVVPFFAQFLDEQEYPRVRTHIKAGPGPGGGGGGPKPPDVISMKYPSDDDEEGFEIPFP